MLHSKTVFVIGAGASQEAGLPVGSQLRKIISDKLNFKFDDFGQPQRSGDVVIYNALRQRTYAESDATNRYISACWRIRDGVILSTSIDDFIDTHQDDKDVAVCGKLAIAQSILEAERTSKLFFEKDNIKNTIDFRSISDTWYPAFYQLLHQRVTKVNVDSLFDNVTLISFNYDRCIEHFLVHAITTHYHLDIARARHLVEKLTVFHPYGSVGQYFGTSNQVVEFGFKGLPEFDSIMKNLKTYSEQIEDREGLKKIRDAIVQADVLVFLGTAFHDNNMALLRNETSKPEGHYVTKRIFATRKGINSEADFIVVKQQLADLCQIPLVSLQSEMHFTNECHQLFDEYQKSMRK